MVVAHTFGSILWVASNVLLQMSVPDVFRGRVFAAELMALSVVQSFFTVSTALALDRLHASPRTLAIVIGACLLVPAAFWRGVRPGSDRVRPPESRVPMQDVTGWSDPGLTPV